MDLESTLLFAGSSLAAVAWVLFSEKAIEAQKEVRRENVRDLASMLHTSSEKGSLSIETLPPHTEVYRVARMEEMYGPQESPAENPLLGREWPENDRFVNIGELIWFPPAVHSHPRSVSTVCRAFQHAGPTESLYWHPGESRVAIVTCGGLCPGLNTVIRELVMCLHYTYGVSEIDGIVKGYRGFYDPELPPIPLSPSRVASIHREGGTILGSSRGGFDAERIVASIRERGYTAVFIIGGDGTHRGALCVVEELAAQNVRTTVACIPKTIDCDIPLVDKTFGYETAVARAAETILAAETEAVSTPNGVGVVELMGRSSGFIAAGASLAALEANLCLLPEVPYKLSEVCEWLAQRLSDRSHATIVIAEGAIAVPDDFDPSSGEEGHAAAVQRVIDTCPKDASGNPKLPGVGVTLVEAIKSYFQAPTMLERIGGVPPQIKFISPSYMIRSVPSDSADAAFCSKLAFNAVHGAMSGFTAFSSGTVDSHGVLIPIKEIATRTSRRVDVSGRTFAQLCRTTGQPRLDGVRKEDGGFVVPTTPIPEA